MMFLSVNGVTQRSPYYHMEIIDDDDDESLTIVEMIVGTGWDCPRNVFLLKD